MEIKKKKNLALQGGKLAQVDEFKLDLETFYKL